VPIIARGLDAVLRAEGREAATGKGHLTRIGREKARGVDYASSGVYFPRGGYAVLCGKEKPICRTPHNLVVRITTALHTPRCFHVKTALTLRRILLEGVEGKEASSSMECDLHEEHCEKSRDVRADFSCR